MLFEAKYLISKSAEIFSTKSVLPYGHNNASMVTEVHQSYPGIFLTGRKYPAALDWLEENGRLGVTLAVGRNPQRRLALVLC
jgi:hypothetical protein